MRNGAEGDGVKITRTWSRAMRTAVDDDTYTALVVGERDLPPTGNVGLTKPLAQGKALVTLIEVTWDCIGEALASVHPGEAGELDCLISAILRCAGFGEDFRGGVAFLEVQADRRSSIVAPNGAVTASFVWDPSDGDGRIQAGEEPASSALRAIGVERGEFPTNAQRLGWGRPCALDLGAEAVSHGPLSWRPSGQRVLSRTGPVS